MARDLKRLEKARREYRAVLTRYEATGNRFLWKLLEDCRDRYAKILAVVAARQEVGL